jgi:IS605 OrfB family transposase
MIRSSKTSLKFTRKGKSNELNSFINEYRTTLIKFVDLIWDMDKIPSLLPKEITSQVTTWLTARAVQCAAKQASGIVRGTQIKQKRRLFMINKFIKNGNYHKARKLKVIYNKVKQTKPDINNIECELDERFVNISWNKNTTFDGWVTLTCLGNKLKLNLPVKKHKHFNSLLKLGDVKKGIRISKTDVTFNFDIKDPLNKEEGKTLGIDIGQKTTLSCSDGQQLDQDIHGHNYQTICRKLSRKVKDSKSFSKTVTHRRNYLQWIVNNLNLEGVKVVNRENIKNLRKFTNTSRLMKHWNYAELFEVLDNKLVERGVLVNKVSPTYTSQRCSACGWTRKSNRKGKKFRCGACSFEHDSDLNAALNLGFTLPAITTATRLKHNNIKGFYWNVLGKEPIVPHVQKS